MKISSVFIIVLLLAVISYAAADVFQYDDKGKRDPFSPLAGSNIEGAEGLENIQSIGDVKLEGIIWSPEKGSLALINGVALKEGDSVGVVRLVEIQKDRVTIAINDIEYELFMAEIDEEYLDTE